LGKKPEKITFLPVHLILFGETQLVFGVLGPESENRYVILYMDRIQEAACLKKTKEPPSYVYAQTTHNQDIEIVISRDKSDLLLIFAAQRGKTQKQASMEYTLLVQTELFA
jgi:hypothetical protein